MVFVCSICASFEASSVKQFVSHLSLRHRNEPNFFVLCGVDNCVRKFRNLNSFKSHLSRDHKHTSSLGQPRRETVNGQLLQCPCCQALLSSLALYVQHCKTHMQRHNSDVECPIAECKKKYSVYSSFTSHVSRSHCLATVSDVKAHFLVRPKGYDAPDSASFEDIGGPPLDSDDAPQVALPKDFEDQYIRNFALFLLKIQEKYVLPYSTVQNIVEDMTLLGELTSSSMLSKVQSVLQRNQVEKSVYDEISGGFEENVLKQSLSILDTQWKRDQYYMKNFDYIPPKEFSLGRNESHKLCTFQYVSIIHSLKRLLQNETFESGHEPKDQNRWHYDRLSSWQPFQ